MPLPHKPRLIVVAGPNGSGKTSLTQKLLDHEWAKGCLHINPDEIAKAKYGDWDKKENFIAAARDAERLREECLQEKRELTFETVLSRPDKIEVHYPCVSRRLFYSPVLRRNQSSRHQRRKNYLPVYGRRA